MAVIDILMGREDMKMMKLNVRLRLNKSGLGGKRLNHLIYKVWVVISEKCVRDSVYIVIS